MEKPIKCCFVSWDQAYRLGRKIARKIKASGFVPDLVIGVSRGGLVPARMLCDFLDQKDLTSMKVEHWGIADNLGTARIKFPLPEEIDISGKKILIVDDVADTGDTYHVILDHIKERYPAEVRTAVLQYKTSSKFIPDYWGEKQDAWKWIIYPWALYEDMTGFIKRMLVRPMTPEEIRKGLKSSFDIRISRKDLSEFLNDMRGERKIGKSKKGSKFYWDNTGDE
ncbi:MAG: phosphoribosyltransferase [Candidatus Methanoperedens sp.]|nr:phosphoribosyltransferase [Candidatus Methanoperedens sp.]